MNERAVVPPAPEKAQAQAQTPPRPAAPAPLLVKGSDREFLPAALEILETPPAPLPVATMLTICGFFAAALVWSYFGQLDVHAVAPGKIETVSRAKIVQPFDSGKILAIHVANGQHVKAGDVLMEIDPAEAKADSESARTSYFDSIAEVARRNYEVGAARTLAARAADPATAKAIDREALDAAIAGGETGIGFTAEVPSNIRLRQRAVLSADLNALADQLSAIDKQVAEKEATRQRLNMSIAFQNQLMVTMTDRVHTRQEAIDRKVGTKINLYDAKEGLQKSQSQLASDQGQLIETEAALNQLRSEKFKTISQFVADNENKSEEASRKADDAKQALLKAEAKLERTRLVAPINGVAQQLSVTTIGQVVTTGQQLLLVTPNEGPLQIEALVANLDIGFVKLGQEAVIKVDAFPFTRFGTLRGKVVRIAQQAVDETEAKRALANITSSANSSPPQTSAPGQPESFVFPVEVEIDGTNMKVGDTRMPLNPGMTVTVEIKTDSRSILEYLLSPIAKVGSEAFRER